MFLFCGSNTTELMAWPWRIVFLSNVAGSVVSFILAMSDALSDLYYLHLFTSMLTFLWWITFSMCLLKKPTFVRNSNSNKEKFKVKQIKTASGSSSSSKNRHLDMSISEELVPVSENVSYASVLEVIGKSTSEKDKHLKLCHSCRVIKPLRSKHCKVQRRCVHRVSACPSFNYLVCISVTSSIFFQFNIFSIFSLLCILFGLSFPFLPTALS